MAICDTHIPKKISQMTFSLTKYGAGAGNGKPLQCSCLESPVDRGTWWTVVHRVA